MIELKNVRKIYKTKIGETAALDGVSLTFPDKGLVFITGKSGSGKTTMLNVIGGLDGFDEGEIIIGGRSFKDLTAKDYDNYRNTFIGVVFQEYNLLPEYTVEKNIKIATELQGIEATDEQVDSLLSQVEILPYKKRLPSQLSGGQMQRVAIARALIKNPHIILADEPTGALDSVTGVQVIETFKKLSETKLVIIISHDLELAEKYADRIISLKDGKIIGDVLVEDSVVEGGVYDGDVFYVKAGAKLTNEEGKQLIQAVADSKPIEMTENLKVREKRDTGKVEAPKGDRNARELISSKMKFKSSAWLGLKSLTVKPVRLIITILLATIAFGLFGVIDSVASYDRNKIIYYNLQDSGFTAIMSSGKYVNDVGDSFSTKLNQETIKKINKNTGYSFKGVHYLDDFDDPISNIQGKHAISQISAYNTKVKQTYYMKNLYGQIEFDSSKIVEVENADGTKTQYIREGGFDYKVLYGTYPNNKKADGTVDSKKVNEVGISSYIADCIMQYCGQNNFGKTPIVKMEDLIGKTLTLDTTRRYTITCIIDCGEIPERYSPLKTTDEKHQLESELKSFLHSGAYLYLFTDTGHFEYHKQAKNGVQVYRMPASTTTLTIANQSGAPYSNNKNQWLAVNDLPSDKYLTFAESQTTLDNGTVVKGNVEVKQGEALININKLTTFFAPEYATFDDPTIQDSLTPYINIISSKESTFEAKREALTAYIKILQDYKPDPNMPSTLLGTTITGKNAKVQQFFERSKFENTVELKIVGVYFDVNDNNPAEWFLAAHKADFEDLKIYTEQGDYSRMISPVVNASTSRRALSNMMCREDGLVLDWFNNSIINMLEASKEPIEVFFEIFFYLDLVIAVFAVFMLTNYISTSIIQKRQTIGILRALGSGGKDIFIIFIIESLVIAVVNGILAAFFGLGGCAFVNFYIKEFMAINVSFAIFEMRQAMVIFFSSLITAILASLIPIIRICQRKPVELIRKSY